MRKQSRHSYNIRLYIPCVLFRNATCGAGSTGKICSAVASLLDHNVENYIFYSSVKTSAPHGKKHHSKWNAKLQALRSRVFGNYEFNTVFATKRLLKELAEISPDVGKIKAACMEYEGKINYYKKETVETEEELFSILKAKNEKSYLDELYVFIVSKRSPLSCETRDYYEKQNYKKPHIRTAMMKMRFLTVRLAKRIYRMFLKEKKK